MSQGGIAIITQQAAHNTLCMVVVDVQVPLLLLSARRSLDHKAVIVLLKVFIAHLCRIIASFSLFFQAHFAPVIRAIRVRHRVVLAPHTESLAVHCAPPEMNTIYN